MCEWKASEWFLIAGANTCGYMTTSKYARHNHEIENLHCTSSLD